MAGMNERRTQEMFWMMMNGMGPRGPMHGPRGFNRGFGPARRPMGCRNGIGMGVLFALPALLFGGWVILAVIGAVIGAAIMILSSVFGGLASVADSVFSGISSGEGLAVGFMIGFVLYTVFRRRNARKASAQEETEEETAASGDPVYAPVNSLNNRNG